MAKNVTMRDIAKKVGVSTVTVSKALTDKDGVGAELRAMIKATADEMGYTYTGIGDGFRRGRSYNIGVIVEEHYVDNSTTIFPFYMKMYNSINKQMAQFHYSVIMEAITSAMLTDHIMPDIVAEKKVDGVIVLGQIKSDYLNILRENGLPMVYLDFYDRTMEVPSVINDNVYGTYMLTNYIVGMGHKKIAYVGSIDATASILVRYEEGYFIDLQLPEVMPTAFVCNCDGTANLLMRLLISKGYRVPQDISVVGFDNYSAEFDYNLPKLTTIEVNIEEMTKNAVEMIIRLLKGEENLGGRKVISGKLIIRDSVAPCPETSR